MSELFRIISGRTNLHVRADRVRICEDGRVVFYLRVSEKEENVVAIAPKRAIVVGVPEDPK